MLTQRERIALITRKLQKHNYFENGPCGLTREEAATILEVLEKRRRRLDLQHDRYVKNIDENRKKSRERYAKNKDSINEARRQNRYLRVVEEAFR